MRKLTTIRVYTGSPEQLEQLKKDIDARAEEVVKKLQEKGIIDKPYQGNSHGDDYSYGRDKGFFEGMQHAINVLFYEQINTTKVDSEECKFYQKLINRLEAERTKLENQNEPQ